MTKARLTRRLYSVYSASVTNIRLIRCSEALFANAGYARIRYPGPEPQILLRIVELNKG